MKKQIILSFFILLLLACSKKYSSIPHGYFTYEYQNAAWGPQHELWVIDAEGKALSFDKPDIWHHPDSLGYIGVEQLLANLANSSVELNKVSKRKLYKNNKLIKGASKGSFSEKSNTSYDMGASTFSCYHYDSEKGKYKKVILAVEGDWSYANLSKEAKEIVYWMKSIE